MKALFITTAALDFEADLLARDAERKAELLRQADRYDAEGLHGIAQHLRQQSEALSLQRPLASVLPSVDHLLGNDALPLLPLLQAPPSTEQNDLAPKPLPASRSKKKGQ